MNAYPYIRVSGKSQRDGDGPERQFEKIVDFISKHFPTNPKPTPVIEDLGVSGTVDGFDRPGLTRFLELAVSGDALVVERMDRLARDLTVQEVLLAEFRKRGIKLYSADNELVDMASNDGDPTRVLIRQILGAVSQWEKSVIVAKLKAARDKKRRETGRCGGSLPYGKLPGEADVLTFMLQNMQVSGMTYGHLAGSLNLSGYKTREGKNWNKQRVYHVLKKYDI